MLRITAAIGTLALLSLAAREQDPGTAPWPRHGDYVGPDRCARCHEFEAEAIAGSVHREVVHSAATVGCETCHGPGAVHASDEERKTITHPMLLPPRTQAALCGRCHAEEARGHGGGGVEGFLAAGLGCVECHPVHEETTAAPLAGVRFRSRAATLASAEPIASERCASCHPLQAQALAATGHQELASGEDGCTTCHGHGSLHARHGLSRLIARPDRASDGVDTCVRCHDDVDPVRAHWSRGDGPYLAAGLSCFDCHSVHGARTRAGVHGSPVHDLPRPESDRDSDPRTDDLAAADREPGAALPPTIALRIDDTNALCSSCHASAFTEHIAPGSVHAAITRPSQPLATGCAACHAGAAEHARAGGTATLVESLRNAPGAVVEATCLQCHEREHTLRGLHSGAHARNGVSCTACHSASAAHGEVRRDGERGCASCHAGVAAEFRLPNHHPVGDGGHMYCSDCHEPHSARRRLRDLELREGRCVECHRAYRGPFVFEHQASRSDGCVICHTPHGSSNRRLLVQADTQQNCIACHGDFPSFHDQTAGSIFTNCLSCHTRIHGSDHSRFLFR